jgi:uncharacterized lipoprotein YmbA
MKNLLPLAALLALTACTSLTPAGQQVRVTENDTVVQGCQYLGSVRASDRLNGGLVGASTAETNVEKRLQNQAAEKGGDTVLMKVHDAGTSGASARGEVYRCAGKGGSAPQKPSE